MEQQQSLQQGATIHIYDDTQRFLDFVCEKCSNQIDQGYSIFFVSQNITLSVLLNAYNTVPDLAQIIFKHNLWYESTDDFFRSKDIQESVRNAIMRNSELNAEQTCFVMDFGSFAGCEYTVQDIISVYEKYKNTGLEIMFCFDCRLLSSNELSYIMAMSQTIFVNNIIVTKQQSREIKIPASIDVKNVNGLINQQVLDLIVKLAQTQTGSVDAKKQLSDLRGSQKKSQSMSRDLIDKQIENSFLISDKDADSMLTTNSQINLITKSGGLRRISSKRGSMLNLNFQSNNSSNLNTQAQNVKQEDDNVIQIQFDSNNYRY